MKTILILSGLALSALLFSCTNSGNNNANYTTSPKGLKYQIITGNSAQKAQLGNFIQYSSTLRTTKGELIFASAASGNLLLSNVIAADHDGDPKEILTMLGEGDSVSMLIPESEFFKNNPLPAQVKKGDQVVLDLKIYNVYTADQYNNDILPTMKAAPYLKEEQTIKDYIQSKGWEFTKTPSGLFIVTDKPGSGKKPAANNKVKVNYSGFLLNGTPFDSSVDPQFNHVQPFEFTIGTGQVIKGWDEGIPYFAKGGKGKLIIPARLAYGEQGSGANIPPNSPLMFEIELLDFQ
jgi:FKBP-type peptidyl-prolyl cis-trans isomerase